MFYCNSCADRNRWPKSFLKSQGQCEVCKTSATCSDTPSRYLGISGRGSKPTTAKRQGGQVAARRPVVRGKIQHASGSSRGRIYPYPSPRTRTLTKTTQVQKKTSFTSLETARHIAVALGLKQSTVSVDDVQEVLTRRGIDVGYAAGSIFRTNDWNLSGERASRRQGNRGRIIKTWALRNEALYQARPTG